jgi:caa(3)-type oxidase subunit IV
MASAAHGHSEHGNGLHGDPNSPFHIKHPPKLDLWKNFAFLMVMLVVTVVMYKIDLSHTTGWVGTNVVIAMIISAIKATAVIWIFMNVRNSTRLTWLWAALGFIWLILLVGIFMDYQTRAWIDQTGWTAIPSEYEIGGVSSRPPTAGK